MPPWPTQFSASSCRSKPPENLSADLAGKRQSLGDGPNRSDLQHITWVLVPEDAKGEELNNLERIGVYCQRWYGKRIGGDSTEECRYQRYIVIFPYLRRFADHECGRRRSH